MTLYSVNGNVGLTQALVLNAARSLWKLLNNNSLSETSKCVGNSDFHLSQQQKKKEEKKIAEP